MNDKISRRGHPFGKVQRPVPRYGQGYGTPFGEAAKALNIAGDVVLAAMLGNRVSRYTVRAWRRGLRPAPEWALDALAVKCAQLRADIEAADRWLTIGKEKARQNEAG